MGKPQLWLSSFGLIFLGSFMDGFRTLIRGWLGKVLLVLFLAPLVFVGLESYFAGSSKEDVGLKVNDQEISKTELDNWVKQETDQYLKAVNGDVTLIDKSVIEAQVYDAATVRALLTQQAEKLGMRLNAEQLGTMIRQQAAFQENGKFSDKRFQEYLLQNGSTVDQLLSQFGQRLSLSLLTNSIQLSTLYSPQQAEQLLTLLGQERTAQIAELPLANFASNFVASEAQLKSYYAAHSSEFKRPATVDVQYVLLPKARFADQAQITEAEINAQYQAYLTEQNKAASRQISQILISQNKRSAEEALQRAQSVVAKLKSGEAFATLVQQYSDDEVTRAAQGKVEGYTVGAYGDSFDQSVLALQQGQTSAPVKTQYGYHIIRVDQIDASDAQPLAQVRDQLIQTLKAQKSSNAFQDAVAAANDIAVQSDAADAIASQYNLPVQTVKSVAQGSVSNAILADSAVKQRIFSDEVRDGDRNLSTAINLQNGDVVWVKVLNYRAAGTQSLNEARPQLLTTLKRQAQIAQAKASVAKLLADLKTKPAAEALAGSSLKFQNVGAIPRYSQVLPASLERTLFSLAAPKDQYWSAATVDSGAALYVVALSKIGQNPELKLNDQQKLQVVNRFDPRGQLELNDYIEYLKSTAKITQPAKK